LTQKQIKILFLLLLSSFLLIAQEKKLDSVLNILESIKNENDFKTFKVYQEIFWKTSEDVKFNPNNIIYFKPYKKAFKWALKQNDSSGLNYVKYSLAKYYFRTANDKKFIRTSLELKNNSEFLNTKESVSTLSILAQYYLQTEQFVELLNLYPLLYKQIKKHQINDYRTSKGYKNNKLGNLYYRLKNYKKSRELFKKSELNYAKEGKKFQLASAKNNIGLTFLQEKKFDSAKYYFDAAIKILKTYTDKDIKKIEIDNFLSVVKSNKVSIWAAKKEYKKVLPFYLKELKDNLRTGNDFNSIRSAYLKIAKTYYNLGKIDIALKYLDSTEWILKKYPHNTLKKDFYNLKGKCLLVKGNILKANTYFDKLKQFRDSIEKKHIEDRSILATIKYETSKKEKELLLSKQKIKIQKSINKYLIFGVLFLITIIAILFFLIKKILKDKKVISEQRAKTQLSLEEKNTLLKEVHHRVKNNLQIIISILDLQNLKSNDEKLSQILLQGQNRIQSMALVHQQLYQSESINDISIKKYLEDLITHISSLNSNKNIKFNIQTNNIKFKINTAVPLGLITNELITNIYKHAFDVNQIGSVTLEIAQIDKHYYKLIIKDSGKGFPKDFDINKINSLGLKLVQILTKQLKGKLEIKNKYTLIYFRDDVAV
jgi:two-component sensor histidine kinase